MSITVSIPATLRHESDGKAELRLPAGSVQSTLDRLESSHPALYRSVCDDAGRVRPHVNLFVDHELLDKYHDLGRTLVSGQTLSIMPAVSGG